MITKIKNGKLLLPDGICEKNLYFENGTITAITEEELPFDAEYDAGGNFVSAGFIDIHVHGGAGFEFVDATKEALCAAANMRRTEQRPFIRLFPPLIMRKRRRLFQCLKAIKMMQMFYRISTVHI